ncbi:MAG: type II toxin-antitoxin system RelE/ParE family toxin [Proteobacteria bacterium]|nr:type II toxin-antitoxin system RelE/ParE family toxin [Pseudomonadota bacterium]
MTKKRSRIFKTAWFKRFARKNNITNAVLKKAISDAEKGIIDADLGGGVIKQRIARSGQGKSGGYRTIILFKKEDKAFFMYGFAKNDLDNLSQNEVKEYKKAAKIYLSMTDEQINAVIAEGEFTEVK